MTPPRLRVSTHSGYKADERPTDFALGERILHVREVVDRWYGEEHAYFKLLADDGNLYLIRHDIVADEWELVLFEAVSPGGGAPKGES